MILLVVVVRVNIACYNFCHAFRERRTAPGSHAIVKSYYILHYTQLHRITEFISIVAGYQAMIGGLGTLEDSIRRFSTDTPWEAVGGYSRAVRSGNRIYVAGTTASSQTGALGLDDAGEQTRAILEIIQAAIESLGGDMSNVVRTRIYVKDISLWESVARVHGEFFADVRPACTLVEARLVDDSLLVEIEAEAVVVEDSDAL